MLAAKHVTEPLRKLLKRSPRAVGLVQAARGRAKDDQRLVRLRAGAAGLREGDPAFTDLAPEAAVRMAYQVVLGRDADPAGLASFAPQLAGGGNHRDLVANLVGSEEFATAPLFRQLGPSMHLSRCAFIRSLPRARRILDLGGTHLGRAEGAFVALGYPYDFDELVLVDLPPDERHPLYLSVGGRQVVATPRGPVRYAYHSMVELADYADDSFDLVYSGQTIEHVSESDGDQVLKEVVRVLAPGGHLAIDTPNGRVTRMQQDEFIDPDHEVEYTAAELTAKVRQAGLEVLSVMGLNYNRDAGAGTFDEATVAAASGLYAAAEDCYLLAYLCRKPG